MNEIVVEVLAVMIPVIIPPLLAWFRDHVWVMVPDRFVPALLAVAGSAVGGLAQYLEIQIPVLGTDITAWNAAIVALASVGVHQLVKQARAKPE